MRSVAAAIVIAQLPAIAHAEPSSLAVRSLGTPVVETLAPKRPFFSLVRVPTELDPISLGLRPIVPGLAMLEGDVARVAGFARAHAELGVELRPPLRPKLDVARGYVGAIGASTTLTLDGAGSIVGIVDTGVDIAHRDFRNEDGSTRIAWFLDFAGTRRTGNALDERYGGRVWDRSEIDAILAGAITGVLPGDNEGHGTHVAGIAAGNGGPSKTYVGIAPKADLIVVRASDAEGSVDEAAAVMGVKFVFDRAAESKQPAVVNLSLGTQYGAHDGTSSFERGLVQLVDGPAKAIVVAASNEGSLPIHTSIRVSPGGTYRIPIRLFGADGKGKAYTDGQVYAWINKRDRGEVRVGVRAPDGGVWLSPVDKGQAVQAKPASNLTVMVANDVEKFLDGGDTSAAIAVVSGALPVGTFELELEGDGAVELWLQGTRQAIDGPGMPVFPRGAQVEGSIGVPASASGLISVGCVGTRTSFVNMKKQTVGLDDAIVGGRCYFSSAGPAANGAMRPDLLAPGYYVISSLAHAAYIASPLGEFDTPQLVDTEHGALAGTSMSSPFVAGAAALLFQREPTLTQEALRAALQAGARPLIDDPAGGGSPRDHAKGAGILDVKGAVAALDRKPSPPRATTLSMRLGATWLAADGGLPLYGIAVAHDAEGRPADVEGGLVLETVNAHARDALSHPAVGLYRFSLLPDAHKGLETATVRLRGALTVEQKVPIGADRWDAHDGLTAGGGCGFGRASEGSGLALALLLILRRRSRARSHAAATAARPRATGESDRRG